MTDNTFYSRKWNSFSENLISMLANLTFLALWLLAQFGVFWVSKEFGTDDEINQNSVIVIRLLFAIGTIIPIIINMYRDISIMIIQAKKEIDESK